MEEVKFFVLPFPLKTKTKKKILHDHEFAHFADCCKFQINSGIMSEFGLYYFLLFIFYSFELF